METFITTIEIGISRYKLCVSHDSVSLVENTFNLLQKTWLRQYTFYYINATDSGFDYYVFTPSPNKDECKNPLDLIKFFRRTERKYIPHRTEESILVDAINRRLDESSITQLLFYNLEFNIKSKFEHLEQLLKKLSECKGIWYVKSRMQKSIYKSSSSTEMGREVVIFCYKKNINNQNKTIIRTNIYSPALVSGDIAVHFFPDRLVFSLKKYIFTVPYNGIIVEVDQVSFLESFSSIPIDAAEIGQTWKYVNKDGEPDLRFKNNRKMFIALYEQITIKCCNGTKYILLLSKIGFGNLLRDAIENMKY